jgi:succinyl-CoA synthetase beta subunit
MKIHEFQGKQLFRKFGVAVLDHRVASSAAEAQAAFEQLNQPIAVIKSQIHAGGRGKGTFTEVPSQRGVQLVRSAAEARDAAQRMLGNHLVTAQTSPSGQTVRRVLIEAGCQIARELYLGLVLDRAVAKPVLMCSREGGVEIEKVAAATPELIFKEHFDPAYGLESFQVRKLCRSLDLRGPSVRSAERMMRSLCRLFADLDCSLVEVNPLVVTQAGDLVALDSKINFDDNADFRHPDLAELRDLAEEEESEVRAAQAGLSYVKLEGNIGCLVNGAGLAMSTMDIIKLHGGQPANFLDVGGGADADQVTEAFRIILSDPNVQGILVNIFGGIMKCSTIASALVTAAQTVGFKVPLVVRLEGTEVEQGKKILQQSNVAVITADDLTDAAKKIVAAVGKVESRGSRVES